ncbi:PREDICTED: uncharacterized protein LOC106334401 [Brassica oleracea var. oleracea]|uniref:uncharacterized protein LOC106334401 n=1 Tax=Brassica oleracea var. oleracea TaxID=109376 RepID=UPI0006A6AF6E|nr:PREDICTED: uncharacterized protein LOC106334401 [Brassica oleracea var. oleracea]
MAPVLIVMADGREQVSLKEGTVYLGVDLVMKSVYYVEELISDLISVGQLMDENKCVVQMADNFLVVQDHISRIVIGAAVKYLRLWGSDHRPVLAHVLMKPVRRKKKFKFDKRWLDNEELKQVILEGWKFEDLPLGANIMEHIASCRKALSQWRRQNNVNSEKLVDELKEKDEEGLVAIATSYFRQIFESSNPEDIAEALAEVSPTITGDVNDTLTAPVTEWEVKLALFAMHPEKAPGPDGVTALFYQKFWNIVKEDLTRMVNQFLFEGTMAQGLNDTNICLIPKTTKPNEMTKFSPINLCNVSYKIISKVLCQRLKKVMPQRISETQIPTNDRQQIKDTLGIQKEGGMGTYLGIPEDISGSKCKLFAFLKDKLLHKVNGWTGRWLSKGGKEVLIKSILLALPTYVMSSFLLLLEICENLASAIAQFWWSSKPPKRGIHWAKWEKMCAPREEGGIGFRMIHEFNLPLLAKQLRRLVQFPDSLVARVLRGKYYRISSPLRTGAVDTPSYIWTSIIAARKLLLLGIRSKVHSGYGINVWEDP